MRIYCTYQSKSKTISCRSTAGCIANVVALVQNDSSKEPSWSPRLQVRTCLLVCYRARDKMMAARSKRHLTKRGLPNIFLGRGPQRSQMPSSTLTAKASYKKIPGVLELTSTHLQWTQDGKKAPSVRVPLSEASCQCIFTCPGTRMSDHDALS